MLEQTKSIINMNAKFYLLTILFLVITSSCTSDVEKANKKKENDISLATQNITSFLNGMAKNFSDSVTIDSIQILKIDTLNEKKDSIHVLNVYIEKLSKMNSYTESLLDEAQNKIELYRLYKQIGGEGNFYKADADAAVEKMKNLDVQKKALLKNLQSIDSVLKTNSYDSVQTTGYLFIVNVFAKDIYKVNKNIDSLHLALDKNFLINEKLKKKAEFEIIEN